MLFRSTRLVLAELPEGIAGTHAPAAMDALFDGGGNAQCCHQERWQTACKPVGLLANRLVVSG